MRCSPRSARWSRWQAPRSFTTDIDSRVQRGFLFLLGTPAESLPPLLLQDLAEIRAAVPELRSYTTAGQEHIVLTRDAFYTTNVGGVALHQWVADLIAGRAAGDVVAPGLQ